MQCQRWTEKHASYRPAGELFDPSRYGVEILQKGDAADFVQRHHYTSSLPATRLSVGLFHHRGFARELVGVAVFSVSSSQATIPAWTGEAPEGGAELGRFVLRPEVKANGESWFLARAFGVVDDQLRRTVLDEQGREQLQRVRAVLAFSDPQERRTVSGLVICPGHVGTIYQAHNGTHVGRTRARWMWVAPDGRTVSERALSKLRNGERGAAYVERDLLAWGAPRRAAGERPEVWLARALQEGPFVRLRHPGCIAYVWRLDRDASPWPRLPYPKAATARAAWPEKSSHTLAAGAI